MQASPFFGAAEYSDADERGRQFHATYVLASAAAGAPADGGSNTGTSTESRSWWAKLFFPDGGGSAATAAARDGATASSGAQERKQDVHPQVAQGPSVAVPVVPESAILDAGLMAYRARDYRTAMANWLNLAESGNHYAQFFIGGLYADGAGVPRDIVRAAVWWTLAGNQGHDKALEFLATLKPELTAEETVATNLLVRSWTIAE